MRVRQFDLEAFRAYVISLGANETEPREHENEIFAFYHDHVRGMVVLRGDGRFTMAGLARIFYDEFERAQNGGGRVTASIVNLTLGADECDLAAALLAGADRTTCYVAGRVNGKRGGWSACISGGFNNIDVFGGALETDYLRVELSAVLVAIKLSPPRCRVMINIEPLAALRNGVQFRLPGWRAMNWLDVDGRPIANADMWRSLDKVSLTRRVIWKWLQPDCSDDQRDRASELARYACNTVTNWEEEPCSTK
jgi:ribonuclease HI